MSALPIAARPGALLDLSDNTSLYGVPPAAWRALREAPREDATGYPTPFADDLRAALARYAGVDASQITTGCGSDDVLDVAIRVCAEPGERIAFPDPTFSMLPPLARRNRLEPVPVPLTEAFDLDADRMLAARAPVTYLCSPNNPTGTVASRAAIERVLAGARGLVILDEAYAEFAEGSWLEQAVRRPGLLIVRTLSKAFGLAGLRVGYGVGEAALVARLEEARALAMGLPFLGAVPLHPDVRAAGDEGKPVVLSHPDTDYGRALTRIAGQLARQISIQTLGQAHGAPIA